MKKIILSVGTMFAVVFTMTGMAAAQGQYISGQTGVDVGWPNCSATVGPESFGIVGVSDGAGYSANPCLSQQAKDFPLSLSLYVNTGWDSRSKNITATSPRVCTRGDNNCLAYNYGYNAGVYAYKYATAEGVSRKTWWLDVETINTWNKNTQQNQMSLQGEYQALMDNGATTVGVYSTTAQWKTITGSWQNNWPSWGATTWTTAAAAQTYCTGHEFTGGQSYLMQYKPSKSSLDQDVAC